MIRGAAAVLQYFEQVNSPDNDVIHFAIYKKGANENSGSPAIRTPTVEDWNYQKAYDFLSRWLQLQQYGEFSFTANDKTKVSTRGGFRQDFSISVNDNVQVHGIGAAPAMSNDDIERMVSAKVAGVISEMEKEREMKELKAKVIELEKNNKLLERKAEDPWTVFIGEIKPYIPNLLQEAGLIKSKVAGHPNSAATPVKDDEETAVEIVEEFINGTTEVDPVIQQRMEAVVKKFATARPNDWLEILEWMAGKIEKSPGLYEKLLQYENLL